MEGRNLLLVGGVVALAYYLYNQQKKKESEAKAKDEASNISKVVVSSKQVEESIKKEAENKAEMGNVRPMPTDNTIKSEPTRTTTTTTTTVIGSVKLPPANTNTKVVGGIKPKVLLEFESPMVKNIYVAPSRTMSPTLIKGGGISREEL